MRRVLDARLTARALPSGLHTERVQWLYDGLTTAVSSGSPASPSGSTSSTRTPPKYLLYWMQTSVRARYNYALEFAVAAAHALALPLHVVYVLSDRSVVPLSYAPRDPNAFGVATERHAKFALEGLACVASKLQARGLSFQVIHHHHTPAASAKPVAFWTEEDARDDNSTDTDPEVQRPTRSELLDECARHAALVVTDRPYLRPLKDALTQCVEDARAKSRSWGLVQVEGDVVVPCEQVTNKEEYAARTIRPKVTAQLKKYLVPLDHAEMLSGRPPSSRRSTSSSSLLTSPTSTVVTNRSTGSPSVASTTKRSSPRCSSPACASLDRTVSPSHTFSSSQIASPRGTTSVVPSPPVPHLITSELYFRLLKKSHVLDQLLHVHSHLVSQQQQLRRLEADRARADSVQEFVFDELETYKRKFVEAQQFLLELLEAMTALTIQEHELQRGTGSAEAQTIAVATKEEVVLKDLEAHVDQLQSRRHGDVRNDPSLETSRALRAVGLERVEQLTAVCGSYERQLRKSEAELSQALHSAYKDECRAKLKQYEARQQLHDDEIKVLTSRIDNLTNQTSELQGVIDDQRDELTLLRQTNDHHEQRHTAQTTAIEHFGSELKAELRKRYGVVPSVVDARWHVFFPDCTTPE